MKKEKGVRLKSIVSYLNKELRVDEVDDSSNNGLQVQNSGKVTKVACGVDASMDFFKAARKAKADMLIVHHGISWKDSLKRIVRLNYDWVKFLIDNDMALYASHLPLDLHPKYGNNALISKALGLKNIKPIGCYNGSMIAQIGTLPKSTKYSSFVQRFEKAVGGTVKEMQFGPKTVKKVFVVSGGGCSLINEAHEAGADMFVSGEPNLAGRNYLCDAGMNGLFGGHYPTEKFGVEALGDLIRRKYGISAEFIDLGIRD